MLQMVHGAEDVGKKAKGNFVIQRLKNGSLSTSFFDPITRNKLKTMDNCNRTIKVTSSQGKVNSQYVLRNAI